jgi:hypothetical protein
MRKHKWKLIGTLAVGLVLLTVGGFVLWPRPNPVTQETFAAIRPGMPQAEVYAILGEPGNYMHGTVHINFVSRHQLVYAPGGKTEEWFGDGGMIKVTFDPAEQVIDKVMCESEPSSAARLRSYLQELWHRWFPE